jgi:hypothetical protein
VRLYPSLIPILAGTAILGACANGSSLPGDPDADRGTSGFPDAGLPDAEVPDAPCRPQWMDLLANGDFEGAGVGWTEDIVAGSAIIRDETQLPFAPHRGEFAALFGGNNAELILAQTVQVPGDAEDLRVFGHRCWVTTETEPEAFDSLTIELFDGAGEPLEVLEAATNEDAGEVCSWELFEIRASADTLAAALDADLELVLTATSDAASPTSFAFDDLHLQFRACP